MDLYEAMGHTLALQYGERARERRGAAVPVKNCLCSSHSGYKGMLLAPSCAEPRPFALCWAAPAGGSEAHSTFFQRQRGDWEAATQSRCAAAARPRMLLLQPRSLTSHTLFHAHPPSPPTLPLPPSLPLQ